ncbi:TKL protein kinase [Phytophthora nicotianae]|uniref:TKL protein kinase n=1 Tax=Phytophthora nicotianae TaxID=4792 RepID=W2IJ62_PHYNI|nr:TKL protein kinase [Phytophthora nicotianae]
MPSSLSLLEHAAVITVLGFLLCPQQTVSRSTDFVDVYYQVYTNQARQHNTRDGDIHQQFLLGQAIPDEVSEKLQPFGLNFTSLPDLLQQALIWDSGYARGDNGSLAKVYTRCVSNNSSNTMANLSLKAQQVTNTGCKIQKCLADDSTAIYSSFSSNCGPSQLNDIVQCSCASVKTKASIAPVWATGDLSTISSNSSTIPETIIRRHTWSNATAGRSAILFAIHTSDESNADLCASKTSLSSLTIPCIEYRASDDRWCRPQSSSLMSKWLNEYVATLETSNSAENEANRSVFSPITDVNNDDSANATSLQHNSTSGHWQNTIPVLIVGAAALIVTGIAVFMYLRQRSEKRKAELQNSGANRLSMSSTQSSTQSSRATRKPHKNPLIDREDIFGNPHDCIQILTSSPLTLSHTGTAESHSSESPKPDNPKDSDVLNTLTNDPHLKHAQIPFDRLQFHHLIARGTHEVWLCVLRDRCVAVKRLSKEERKNLDEVRAFIKTIRLSALLQHPSILSFVGVAWSSMRNLCLVMEYLELGDLQEYLRQSNPNRDQNEIYEDFMSFSLTWKNEKMQILLDITRGLVYLHRKRIIHGDLRAKNVLLSADLDAKLTGFGVVGYRSDNQLEKAQSTRPNTPFWTAPEVLAGGAPSRKADIYSLGVVIAELDTHRSPFSSALTARGSRMPPLQVLQHIVSGHLKPNLSPTCPSEIADLAEWCLQRDPDARPSASDVVQAVRSIPGYNLDEFSL